MKIIPEIAMWEAKAINGDALVWGTLRIEHDKAYILETCYSIITEPPDQPLGFNCGVEDRGYQDDGYAAANYGWEEAISRYAECLPVWEEVYPDSLRRLPLTPHISIVGSHPPRPLYTCPVCEQHVGYHHKHCLNCGMAFEWQEIPELVRTKEKYIRVWRICDNPKHNDFNGQPEKIVVPYAIIDGMRHGGEYTVIRMGWGDGKKQRHFLPKSEFFFSPEEAERRITRGT